MTLKEYDAYSLGMATLMRFLRGRAMVSIGGMAINLLHLRRILYHKSFHSAVAVVPANASAIAAASRSFVVVFMVCSPLHIWFYEIVERIDAIA